MEEEQILAEVEEIMEMSETNFLAMLWHCVINYYNESDL